MPRRTAVETITAALNDLRAQRAAHVSALAEIDALFAQFGITETAPPRKPGRPAASATSAITAAAPKKRKGKRGHFAQTADEFVLGLLKGKSMMTSEVNAAWIEAGRGARADTTLSNLAKAKKLKKNKIKGHKGSTYTVA
jgi:hypothetical protein